MKLLAGNSNPELSQGIAALLGVSLVDATIKRFADNEIFVKINEPVRGEDVFVMQSTCFPANDHLMELLIIINTLKGASAQRVTAVMPYFGYARQDRRAVSRTPISAKLVADIIFAAGADRVMVMDLHAGQIQGFFNIPMDNLQATPIFEQYFHQHYSMRDAVVVSPDIGGVGRARALAGKMGLDLALVDKHRCHDGRLEAGNIIGAVDKKDCIIIDDIVDSADTLCNAAEALLIKNARSVRAFVTHGVLSQGAVEKIRQSGIAEVVITNSISQAGKSGKGNKIIMVSAASLFADAIRRIVGEKPISGLFKKNVFEG